MDIVKCDICNKPADSYMKIKYKMISDNKAGTIKQIDVCKECINKHFKKLK